MVAIEMGEAIHAGGEGKARLPKEARLALHALAAEWGDVTDCRALEVKRMQGAMTNGVFQVTWRAAPARKVLVRVYGDGASLFFDRKAEELTFDLMSRNGQGPRLLRSFHNGRVEQFLHARTLSASDLHDPEISALVASKLREFHDLDMPGPRTAQLWVRLRNWLKIAKSVCTSQEAKEFGLDTLEEDIAALEEYCSAEDQRISFCHNDLQYGNMMIEEGTRLLIFIDYEYASHNPAAFDIANHFCEMAADYHSGKPHLLDFSKYPDAEEQRRFVQMYLSSSGEEAVVDEAENLLKSIEKYMLASHLVWGLWGLISKHVNGIDFDYMEYARQRFQQYWEKKSVVLTRAKPELIQDIRCYMLGAMLKAKDPSILAEEASSIIPIPGCLSRSMPIHRP